MTNLRTLALHQLLRDGVLAERLVAAGDPLLVERAAPGAAAAAVASLANTLGGWVLVDLDGQPGADVSAALDGAVEPPVPAQAATTQIGGRTVAVVRVAASSDTPHATTDGAILVRGHDGMSPADAATVRALVERGERGDAEARERLHGRPLVEDAMRTPDRLPGDAPILDPDSYGHDAPLEFIVRGTPVTVSREVAAAAVTADAARLADAQAIPLLVDPDAVAHRVATQVDARPGGVYCTAERGGAPIFADLVIDGGGVVAARLAERRQRDGTVTADGVIAEVLLPLLRTASGTLEGLGATGRALLELEIRGTGDLMVEWTDEVTDAVIDDTLVLDGELELAASPADLQALAERWARGLARAAGLPAWEPR
jgi:hypothetical protein